MTLRIQVEAGSGDDAGAIERALGVARAGRLERAGGAEIILKGGRYFIDRTLELTAPDSGSGAEPFVVRAEEGEEVRLIGGRILEGFRPAAGSALAERMPAGARGRVMRCNLKKHGITDYGSYRPRGHGSGSAHAPLELFFNGRPMTVARWPKAPPLPNRGFAEVKDFKHGRLYFGDDRPRCWASLEGVHLHGYFANDWSSAIVRVADYDPASNSAACDPARIGAYGARAGGRFFFFNVSDELEEPGEWFLDRADGMLYFLPPSPVEAGEAIASTLDGPLFRLRDVCHVRLEGLVIEAMRGDGIAIEGGTGVVVGGCVLRNIGRHGVSILGGTDHAVLGCDIYETGECGVDILAGDRRTLTPCRHRVDNCHLHHIAREGWTYCDAVRMAHNLDFGCGVTLTRNRMHEHRHTLVHYKGNDHRIEGNEFYNMTLEGDDCGCLYTGRDFAMQGNVVRGNHLHHAGGSGRSDWGCFGVYMDDCGGGTEIEGNLFHRVDKAVLAGGGINVRVHDNLFVDCRPAVWFDERGASAGADGPGSMVHETMRGNALHVDALNPDGPYVRYPHMDRLARAFREHLGVYTWGGGVYRNTLAGCGADWLATYWTTYPPHFEFHGNRNAEEGDAVDRFGRPSPGGPVPPSREIGLRRDRYRPRLKDAWSRLEVVRPAGGAGEPGLARLVVQNDGDLPVEGEELVEFKTRRHGPGFAFVRVPYRVEPGATGRFEFAVALDPVALKGQFDFYMCSRGEHDVRPAWVSLPVAYGLDSGLALLAPPVSGEGAPPARVRMTVRNAGAGRLERTVRLLARPGEEVLWETEPLFPLSLEPGEAVEREAVFRPRAGEGALPSRIVLETVAEGLKPARLPLIVEYPLAAGPALSDPAGIGERLAGAPRLPFRGPAKNTVPGHYGEIRLAVAGEALALEARLADPDPRVTSMIWDGSSLEIYACSPDRERIGAVFGHLPIGQVYLVPAAGGAPARGLVEKDNAQHLKPEIRVLSRPAEGGYILAAIVPLALLAVSPGCRRFLFEVQVNTPRSEGGRACRGNLFGSYGAFNDTSRYALARVGA